MISKQEDELDREIMKENERNISLNHSNLNPNNQDDSNVNNQNISQNNNKNINEDSDDDKETPIVIKAKLLDHGDSIKIKKQQTQRFDPLSKNNFKSEANGLLQIEPKTAIFKGFEIQNDHENKTLTKYEMIVKVINTSKFPQRVNIIPPTTVFFKVKFTRSGLIPCGLAETIVIQFFPQRYQYYYDFIQVYGEEQEKLILPIHAYPVMNIHKYPKYIPRFISFDAVMLNHSATKSFSFSNLIETASFEFEFVPVSTSPEIQINPIFGEIEAQSEKTINITFSPVKYGTYISEYEFRLSEYNFEPIKLVVSGCCKVYEKSKLTPQEEAEILPIRKNLPIYKLKKHIQKITTEINDKKPQQISPREYLKNLMLNKEKTFIDYFDYCETRIRDKEIKYKEFIGRPLLTNDEIKEIKNNKFNEYKQFNWFNRKVYSQIFSIQKDKQPANYLINQYYALKPLFNKNRNDNFFKSRKYFHIFLSALTKIVINKRALDKLEKLSPLLRNNAILNNKLAISRGNINNENDQLDNSRLNIYDKVDELFKNNKNTNKNTLLDNLNHSIHSRKTEDSFVNNNDFEIDFSIPNYLNKSPIYVNDNVIDFSKQVIPYENNIYFDELKPYDYVDRMDQELINYKDFKSNGINQYEISLQNMEIRPPIIVYESFYSGETGDSELEYSKIKPIICAELITPLYKRLSFSERETIIFFNPNLRSYNELSYYIESNLDFNLQGTVSIKKSSFQYTYYILDALDYSCVLNPNGKVLESYPYYDKTLDFNPDYIKEPLERDLNVKLKEVVDEDNFVFDIFKDDHEKFIEYLEQGEDFSKYQNELENYDDYLVDKLDLPKQLQKNLWSTLIPTFMEYYNEGIQYQENKIIL